MTYGLSVFFITDISAPDNNLVSANVSSNQLAEIDLYNNNLGSEASEVVIKSVQIKKAETSSAEAISSIEVSYLCLYGNGLYIFKESKKGMALTYLFLLM